MDKLAVNVIVFSCALVFFQHIGAVIALGKSYITSTIVATRRELAKVTWWPSGDAIPIVTNARDIGAHFCTPLQCISATTTKRLGDAAEVANALATGALSERLLSKASYLQLVLFAFAAELVLISSDCSELGIILPDHSLVLQGA